MAFAQKLAPGNKIRIICEHEPTLSVERTLSPEGDVVLPLLGRVTLAGKFIAEAEAELQKLAAAKLGDDGLLIAVALVADAKGSIEFSGAVVRSGTAPFSAGMTLDDIVKIAQPSGSAATEAIEITGADGRKMLVDLTANGGKTLLKPGDRVFFPQAEGSNEVVIVGGVAKPGSKPFKPGMTLRELIDVAGGITGHGQPDKIRLDRKGQESKTITLDSPEAGERLQRGDLVTIPIVENGRYVSVNGLVMHPGIVEFRPGMTFSQAIKAAGGLSIFAGGDSIVVKRMGEWKRRFNYAKVLAGQEPDLELKPADIIDVPTGKWRKAEDSKPKPKEKPRTGPVVPPL